MNQKTRRRRRRHGGGIFDLFKKKNKTRRRRKKKYDHRKYGNFRDSAGRPVAPLDALRSSKKSNTVSKRSVPRTRKKPKLSKNQVLSDMFRRNDLLQKRIRRRQKSQKKRSKTKSRR
jgi:hypothetical protein